MLNNWESLYKLYCENNNCDLLLISEEGEKIPVHVIIITAGIPKLRDTILASFDIFPRMGLKVAGVKSRELKQIIQFAYLGRCEMKDDAYEALDLLEASKRLCMNDKLQVQALETVTRNMNMSFAVKLLTPEQKCNPFIKPALEIAEMYVKRNLVECDNAINYISLVNLKALIRDDQLHAPHEELVMKIILQWINHDPKNRLQYMPQLLQLLRLGFVNLGFVDYLRGREELIENNDALAMLEISFGTVISLQSSQGNDRSIVNYLPLAVRPRIPHVTILTLGGFDAQGASSVVEVYDHLADQWNVIPELDLIIDRYYHGAEIIGNFLYIVGGGHKYSFSSDTGQKLNIKTLEWQSIASMSTPRCFVASAKLNGLLYVFGGKYLNSSRLSTCEVYNPITNSWKNIRPMFYPRSDAGIAVLNDKIYLVGGFDGTNVLRRVEVYDPITNTWTRIEPLIQRRSGHKCAVYCGNIFAIGGLCGSGLNRLKSLERYDPNTCKWSIQAEMHTPRSNFGLAQFYDYFIVSGGYIGDCVTDQVEIYDIIQDTWYPLSPLSTPKSATCCIAVDDILFSLMILSSPPRHHYSMLRDLTCDRPIYNPDLNKQGQLLPQRIERDEQFLQIIEDSNDHLLIPHRRMITGPLENHMFTAHTNFLAGAGDSIVPLNLNNRNVNNLIHF